MLLEEARAWVPYPALSASCVSRDILKVDLLAESLGRVSTNTRGKSLFVQFDTQEEFLSYHTLIAGYRGMKVGPLSQVTNVGTIVAVAPHLETISVLDAGFHIEQFVIDTHTDTILQDGTKIFGPLV